jgi:hypothetical protein
MEKIKEKKLRHLPENMYFAERQIENDHFLSVKTIKM